MTGFLTAHDFEGRWSGVWDSGFSTKQAHTGDYSIKVVDNLGPAIKLALQDVRLDGYGYEVSSWVYAESGATPVMAIIRKNQAGSLLDTIFGNVLGGIIKRRQWQRWEAKLTNAQLISGGLFNGNADTLLIRIGTGPVAGQASRIVYVDDIVCRPNNTAFSLTAYDYRGYPSSFIDTHYLPRYFEQDFMGRALVTREERFRTYGQAAEHRLGENQ
jgi:hypothetical protein